MCSTGWKITDRWHYDGEYGSTDYIAIEQEEPYLCGEHYPALVEVWDNKEDALFDDNPPYPTLRKE